MWVFGEGSSWDIRKVIPGSRQHPSSRFAWGVAQKIRTQFSSLEAGSQDQMGLNTNRPALPTVMAGSEMNDAFALHPYPASHGQPPPGVSCSWGPSSPREPWEIRPSIGKLIYLTCPPSYLERQFTELAVSASC